MKKVIIASAALFFAAITNVHASATTTTGLEIITNAQQDTTEKRTPVIPTDLPDPVKQSLAAEDYKGWTPSSAFLVAKEDKEYYEVKLTKEGSEANKVKFSKDGKKVD
jgi:hypothetical protein